MKIEFCRLEKYFEMFIKKVIPILLLSTLLCGWALLLYPLYSIAESYELSYSIIGTNQKNRPGSRSFKRPLVVDLVGHTLTVPSQVVGYTLMLESEEGEVYTYYITGTTLEFPQEFCGSYQITISDGNSMYHSTIEL